MFPLSNKTRKIICQDKVCHVRYFVDAAAEQCFIRSHNPDELCQEMPVDALTDRLKLAKPIQCRANSFLLLCNACNVQHATGDAQSQFRPRINTMQQRCQPPENTSLWFNKLVVKVKVFKTNINKMVYQRQVDTTATGEGCASREEKPAMGTQNGFWIGWRHKAICFLSQSLR